MEVVTLQVFVSLCLVAGSLLLFAFTCRQHDFEHAERLALLPLEDGGSAKTRDGMSTAPTGQGPDEGQTSLEEGEGTT